MPTIAIAWLLKRPIIVAALTALLVGFPSYQAGKFFGARQERSQAELRAAKATIQQLKERGLINEAVNDTDIIDLCIELGGSVSECRGE